MIFETSHKGGHRHGQTRETVLVVDDDKTVLESTASLLEVEGLDQCVAVQSGHEALAILGSTNVDLVLLDLGLPDLSGEEVLVQLRRDHPDIPVVVVTALVDVERSWGNLSGRARNLSQPV